MPVLGLREFGVFSEYRFQLIEFEWQVVPEFDVPHLPIRLNQSSGNVLANRTKRIVRAIKRFFFAGRARDDVALDISHD